MKCSNPCKIFGAYQALGGIEDSVVIFHSVVGCHFANMSFHLTRDMEDLRQTCTVINDRDIILNGENSLRLAIENVISLYRPRLIIVITGCVTEIIKDDVDRIVEEFRKRVDVIYIDGAGFKSDFEKGYEDALVKLVKTFSIKKEKSKKPLINIFGMLYDDYKRKQDILALNEVLGDKVDIGFISASANLESIKRIAYADVNIAFGRGIEACRFLKDKYNQSYLQMDYPYGIEGIKGFLGVIADTFNIDYSETIKNLEENSKEAFNKIYSYLNSLYGLPVCVVGSYSRARGMKRFLEMELGMEVVSFGIREKSLNMEEFIANVSSSDTALVFGSSFDGDIADRLKVPLIPFDYPVYDRVSISNTPYIGEKGAVNLTEDILNSIMMGVKNRGAFYNEEDMYIW
ncbi:MAG: nitrogenase component 1 [Clostridia bacterium]|nr:nitrogenase component 1 [Clostridia bacterium]